MAKVRIIFDLLTYMGATSSLAIIGNRKHEERKLDKYVVVDKELISCE
jgi:hypothetical protein